MIVKSNLSQLAKKAIVSKSSFNKLFEKIYPIIWHYYRIRINNEEDAKDQTQSACLKIVAKLDQFDPKKGTFITWMYRVINNMLIDFYKKKELPMQEFELDLLQDADSPMLRSLQEEEKKRLKEAIGKIGKRQREILEMKYFFNMRNKDIAQSLKIKEKSVSSLITRAFDRLKELLIKYEAT